MKIYSSRQVFDNELDKYIGKDIWVLAHIDYYYGSVHISHDSWVRLIAARKDTADGYLFEDYYLFNEAGLYDFQYDPTSFTYTYRQDRLARANALSQRHMLKKKDITLIKPIEFHTTAELFGSDIT